ncbi:putative mitochondrial protein [Cucumis melo var. makuwa]|uniref:Putative mitochondrial protein n=1 Tax=Cucumis melo var. makuwa TaxID=1194695 RepID=A0A5D3BG87_CUCMM|nr:putative mitochondrial protein [Cucumis melo var. makuwa]
MPWSIKTLLFYLFSPNRALLFSAPALTLLHKIGVLRANIVTFLTQYVPSFLLPHALRNFGVKQLLHPSIPSTVFLLLFFRTSLHSKDYMVLFPTTLTLKSLVVCALFSCILMNTLNLNQMPASVVSLAMTQNIKVGAQRGADRREAGRMCEGHMDASDFLIASAIDLSLVRKVGSLHLNQSSVSDDGPESTLDTPPRHSTRIKTHSDGTIECYKARLVAKGYLQEYGIDYEVTFTFVARVTFVRSLLPVVAAKQWPLLQMEVKNAFLNGTLFEEVYMKPPSALPSLNLDFLLALMILHSLLAIHPKMKDLGSLNYFLGLEVSRRSDGYFLSQAKYASNLLARLEITDSNTSSTSLDPNVHLTSYDGVPLEDNYSFTVVLRILRYIKGTLGHGLQFSSQSSLVLSSYFDADWVGDLTNQRSTTGYYFYLGDSLISYHSKKQSVVSRFSTISEYRALADATVELLWLRWLLADMGVPQQGPTFIHCDNCSAIQIAHNDVFHERT